MPSDISRKDIRAGRSSSESELTREDDPRGLGRSVACPIHSRRRAPPCTSHPLNGRAETSPYRARGSLPLLMTCLPGTADVSRRDERPSRLQELLYSAV